MAILRALIAGAIIAGCLTVPVHAQQQRKGAPAPPNPADMQKQRDAEAIDKQYKATLERTRKDAAEAPAKDPWQNLRSSDDAKTKR
jgi:hypothetical protein